MERDHWGDIGVDECIIQDGSPGGGMWVYRLDWAGPGQGQVADACDCGNEPSGSVKYGEILDQLQNGQLLKKDSAAWRK